MSNENNNGKHKRQIRSLIKLLHNRYNVFSVYTEDIANCLEYPRGLVESELHLLYEEGILEPVWELHCGNCGNVAISYESPHLFKKGPMIPCDDCLSWLETENTSRDALVAAYRFTNHDDEQGM